MGLAYDVRVHASDRAVALSEQLVRAHQTLRERLASLREEIAAGTARPAIAGDLLSHCLSFCTAIQAHHAGEDGQLFPALRAAAPGLAPMIDKLTEDHTLVAGILQQIRTLLAPDRPPAAPERSCANSTAPPRSSNPTSASRNAG
jgi:iron-sulfur cluster repair protein YtfE (RIC family)